MQQGQPSNPNDNFDMMPVHRVLVETVQALLYRGNTQNASSIFDGNVSEFLYWITSFENSMGTVHNPRTRFNSLFDALGPNVKKRLRSCQLIKDPQTAYVQAINTLYRLYGSPHHITDALLRDLKHGKVLDKHDVLELRDFYLLVTETHAALDALSERSGYKFNYVLSVSNRETIEALLVRVPFHTTEYLRLYPTPASYVLSNFNTFCNGKLNAVLDPLAQSVSAASKRKSSNKNSGTSKASSGSKDGMRKLPQNAAFASAQSSTPPPPPPPSS